MTDNACGESKALYDIVKKLRSEREKLQRDKILEEVKDLLKAGCKPGGYKDHNGRTALFLAALEWKGDRGVLRELLKYGANPNHIDNGGKTALMNVSIEMSDDSTEGSVVDQLIKAGIDLDKRGKCGKSALFFANEFGNCTVLSKLVDLKADVNYKETPTGGTALHMAAERGYTGATPCAVTRLLMGGADMTIRNDKGKTAMDLAVQNGHGEAVEILLRGGGKLNTQYNWFT